MSYQLSIIIRSICIAIISILILGTPLLVNIGITQKRASFKLTDRGGNDTLVEWGLTIPEGTEGIPCEEGDQCLDFGVAKVVVTDDGICQKVEWSTSDLSELKDCINLLGHWYGGGQQVTQPWPIEKTPRDEAPFIAADMLGQPKMYGALSERFWVSSKGVAIKVEDYIPLFLSVPDNDGDGTADQMCFSSRYEAPFVSSGSTLQLKYNICFQNNIRKVYEASFYKFYSSPNGIPDKRMMTYPIWSTWAEYYKHINDAKVINFAQAIIDNGFNNSQIEIDDKWEPCYGDAVFDPDKFPDPKGMVDTLHSLGFRVTLWVHPFINQGCSSFDVADQEGYLIKNAEGNTELTSWWDGVRNAGLVDFTNTDAVDWWTGRLRDLMSQTGVDSFKFDAGEASWLPENYVLNLPKEQWPNGFTTAFANTVISFGNVIEDRVGCLTQTNNNFVRMLDKDSNWNYNNGLLTLIPSLLHSSLLGYPYVLPDMIGGNGYYGKPSAELFIRWAQANALMPSMQFSIVPWGFDDESSLVTNASLLTTQLHAEFAPLMLELAINSTNGLGPIARPTWWLCPHREICLLADQQFLLGDNILVTPVVQKNASSLEVVIPPGRWTIPGSGRTYRGTAKHIISGIDHYSNIYFVKVQ